MEKIREQMFERAADLLDKELYADAADVYVDIARHHRISRVLLDLIAGMSGLAEDWPAAEFGYRVLRRMYPDNPNISLGLFVCFCKMGKKEQAGEEMKRMLLLHPDTHVYDDTINVDGWPDPRLEAEED